MSNFSKRSRVYLISKSKSRVGNTRRLIKKSTNNYFKFLKCIFEKREKCVRSRWFLINCGAQPNSNPKYYHDIGILSLTRRFIEINKNYMFLAVYNNQNKQHNVRAIRLN